jgi:hypothetical protein
MNASPRELTAEDTESTQSNSFPIQSVRPMNPHAMASAFFSKPTCLPSVFSVSSVVNP